MTKKSKGRMMLSRKIGNILLIISLAANFSVYAVDCRQVSSNTKIYQETDLSGGVLYLARSNGELEVIAFKLEPSFGEMDKISLSNTETEGWDGVISGTLHSRASNRTTTIRNICESEGGWPQLTGVLTESTTNEDFLAILCRYNINHSGLGIVGTLFTPKIFQYRDKEIKERPDISEALSGYEETSENGDESYYFYKDNEILRRKIFLISRNITSDNLNLSRDIAVDLLRGENNAAVASYISSDRITQLIKIAPINSKNASLYNDIAYSLSQAGEKKRAIKLMLDIEKIAPERAPLLLNIADSLWEIDPKRAKTYYERYISKMKSMGTERKIPPRVIERTGE